jgi:alkanesulfonate monooxygenase SsuD/methylene tetrahydromethanopterin reductase-like flavin-dependent oxidoreductase (luciferase family)
MAFIAYFSENPYFDPNAEWFREGAGSVYDLELSNKVYDPTLGSDLWAQALDEKVFAEAVGFDGIMLNEHHSSPFTMRSGVMNLEAAILARITERVKIVLLGNILPIWDDPLRLLEELSAVDVISKGRLVSGFVRGTGRESYAHNSQPPYNWERFQEAHDFMIKAWTTPGPFRWEGNHYHYRYVNPFWRTFQQPHPPIWIPGLVSRSTVEWAAAHRYPYIVFSSRTDLVNQVFELYREEGSKHGYQAGSEHVGCVARVVVAETEAKSHELGHKFIEGPGNPFLEGSRGRVNVWAQNLPGLNPRAVTAQLPTAQAAFFRESRGLGQTAPLLTPEEMRAGIDPATRRDERSRRDAVYQGLLDAKSMIVGTPDQAIVGLRELLETVRPGILIIWGGDGAMTHDEHMTSIQLLGERVLPAVREIAEGLDIRSCFES